jgi:hypothetical protein
MATTVLTLQQCADPKSNALQMVGCQQYLLPLSTDWLMGLPAFNCGVTRRFIYTANRSGASHNAFRTQSRHRAAQVAPFTCMAVPFPVQDEAIVQQRRPNLSEAHRWAGRSKRMAV